MRKLICLLAGCLSLLAPPASVAFAQVTDAERAAARELFKQGDELQRAGKFPEALDKFERAQQVFSAPTNMLRIAECQAALGRLVESSESYRALVRTPLPPGSPPAFQSAVDQAKMELPQVEPRVPKLVVQVEPADVPSPQMQIDGQSVPGALIGTPLPLDPGTHKVLVFASGYASSEQQVVLKERESKSLVVPLKPIAGVTYSAGTVMPLAPTATAGTTPPPPPPIETGIPQVAPRRVSRTGFLLGAHLGGLVPAGELSNSYSTLTSSAGQTSFGNVSSGGLAVGLDGGLRFARQWYLGLTLEHGALGKGSVSTYTSSDTNLLGLVLAIIGNPERVSLYGEIGLANRWYTFTQTTSGNTNILGGVPQTTSYSAGELLLGLGVWIPVGRAVRLLPEATAGIGSFNAPAPTGSSCVGSACTSGHVFFMFGVAGFYNIDL